MKWFSIDRVFRNETLDATHLAEFHQVEGVVADQNLTLGDLIGVLYEFFSKMGERGGVRGEGGGVSRNCKNSPVEKLLRFTVDSDVYNYYCTSL